MEERRTAWVKVSAVIPANLYIVWDEVVSYLHREGIDHPNELVKNGMVLEVLCAEYLSTKRTGAKKR